MSSQDGIIILIDHTLEKPVFKTVSHMHDTSALCSTISSVVAKDMGITITQQHNSYELYDRHKMECINDVYLMVKWEAQQF